MLRLTLTYVRNKNDNYIHLASYVKSLAACMSSFNDFITYIETCREFTGRIESYVHTDMMLSKVPKVVCVVNVYSSSDFLEVSFVENTCSWVYKTDYDLVTGSGLVLDVLTVGSELDNILSVIHTTNLDVEQNEPCITRGSFNDELL